VSGHGSGVELALRRALAFASRQRLFGPGDRVVVGMGTDPASLGLLGFLLHSRAALGLAEIAVAAVERRLDEESDDAEQVADLGRLARQLGLTFHAVRPAALGGRVRVVDELRKLAQEQGHTRVALAPTRDDDAARVLWELLRGRGVTAIRGLAPRLSGAVVRPLLALERSEAASLASLLGVELPTPPPDEPDPLRDRLLPALESTILPRLRALTPGSIAALAGLGREARRLQRMFAREADALVRSGRASVGGATIELDGAAFAGPRGPWVARAAVRALGPLAEATHVRRDARALAHAVTHPRDLSRAEALVLHGATVTMDGRTGRVLLRRRATRPA
jgi:tRNA(Ile)-lysidine synthase TilS/MesJ